jgi:hypothetical protein
MPVSRFHGQVATVALGAAASHGFALGGGNALIAHGIIDRATQDVDVFSDQEGGVEAAADAVEAALRDTGFGTERRDKTGGLEDLDLEDVVGGKLCALASRVEPRDYVDTAAAMGRYSREQMIGFAHRLDPGLTDRDFSDAVRRLDQWGDGVFAPFGLGPADVAELRARFAAWPRT